MFQNNQNTSAIFRLVSVPNIFQSHLRSIPVFYKNTLIFLMTAQRIYGSYSNYQNFVSTILDLGCQNDFPWKASDLSDIPDLFDTDSMA